MAKSSYTTLSLLLLSYACFALSQDADQESSDAPPQPPAKFRHALIAHGVFMSLAFVILYPLGALIIRIFSFRGTIWVHAGVQAFAYMFVVTGLGLGVWLTVTIKDVRSSSPLRFSSPRHTNFSMKVSQGSADYINHYHPIIGLVVAGLLLIQPILGLVHHFLFVKHRRRTVWAITHVWFGRTLILLGVINGGLGLRLANNTRGGDIAYGIVAAFMFVLYVAVVILASQRSKGMVEGETGETGEKLRGRGASVP
ncbi:MAG: hypothetical protein M1817_002884 [Caeruleum heppii]|nr:MAG: hypothetical protein M1817_002884 [Caeruleum heppii]